MLGAVLRACSQEPVVVLDTGGAVENAGADKTADRIQIANTLGALLKRLLDDGLESTVLIMGGDCLLGLMRQLDVTEIMPLCEVAPGVVLSQFTYGGRQWNLVSKSGGFGAKTLFYDLQNILERWKGTARGGHAAFRTGKKEKIKCVSPGKDGSCTAISQQKQALTR